jgi:hypothetical protein
MVRGAVFIPGLILKNFLATDGLLNLEVPMAESLCIVS